MNVGDEMKQKLERHDLLFVVGGGICQLCCELLNLVDDAVGSRTVRGHGARRDGRRIEAGTIEVGSADLDVNKVPLARLFACAARFAVWQLVSPAARARSAARRPR